MNEHGAKIQKFIEKNLTRFEPDLEVTISGKSLSHTMLMQDGKCVLTIPNAGFNDMSYVVAILQNHGFKVIDERPNLGRF